MPLTVSSTGCTSCGSAVGGPRPGPELAAVESSHADPVGSGGQGGRAAPGRRGMTVVGQSGWNRSPPRGGGARSTDGSHNHGGGAVTSGCCSAGWSSSRCEVAPAPWTPGRAFVDWINAHCHTYGLPDRIPLVGGQRWHLTTSQFRRTLAWFIARRPGGAIAGAIQYRHQRVQMFEGYGTSRSGFRAEVEAEQAL